MRAITTRELSPVTGAPILLPDPDHVVHLQFRRFAGCPVCNLHLRSIVTRHDEILAVGVREVVVFHSSADELRKHTMDLPFAVIADPGKALYREFRVESGRRALLSPRAWAPIALGILTALRRRDRTPSLNPTGGRLGLPADFLIASDGRVLAEKHGEYVYDQWSVDELLTLAGAARSERSAS